MYTNLSLSTLKSRDHMRPIRFALAVLIAASIPAFANDTARHISDVDLQITDKTPAFMEFYRQAISTNASETDRWALWKKLYGVAAVPPGPDGDAMARRMLDAAWPRYPSVIPTIERGVQGMSPTPQAILRRVADLLDPKGLPIKAKLKLFVGQFDDNSYTVKGPDGIPIVVFPIEDAMTEVDLTHEFVHVVNIDVAQLGGGWERTIATTMLEEGLAMRSAQTLVPNYPTWRYVSHDKEWMGECDRKLTQIIEGIRPFLDHKDSDTVMKFTMGAGTTGMEREAYCAGWYAIPVLQKLGYTLADLAAVPEDQHVAIMGKAVALMLAGSNTPAAQ